VTVLVSDETEVDLAVTVATTVAPELAPVKPLVRAGAQAAQRARRRLWRAVVAVAVVAVLVAVSVVFLTVNVVAAVTGAAGADPAAGVVGCGAPAVATAGPVGSWNAEQVHNASVIVAVGQGMGIPAQGVVDAVATAMQESRLINVNYGDRAGPDSRGLFQQRTGWGPIEVRMDPAGAARLFYEALLRVPGWETMPLAQAAQAVQNSALPWEYAKWEEPATLLVRQLGGQVIPASCTPATAVGGFALPLPIEHIPVPTREHHDYPAVDLPTPAGTIVASITAGTVRLVDEPGGCGTGVAVIDASGGEWMYCHGTPGARTVANGQSVAAGDAVMASGWSGSVSPPGPAGAHLHVQLRLGGQLRCVQPVIDALAAGQPVPALESLSTSRPCARS
jgi:hypothetical protein